MVHTHWTACGRCSSREPVRLRCQNVMVAATSQQLRQKSNKSQEAQITVGAAILTALFATVSKQEHRG